MTTLDDKKRYIRNINKLSAGRRTICGEFGIVSCDCGANNNWNWSSKRIFSVRKSKKIANGGTWSFAGLRKAILAAD